VKEKIKKEQPPVIPVALDQGNELKWWWIAAGLVTLVIAIFILIRRQNIANRYEELTQLEVPSNVPVTVEEILMPVSSALNKENKIFYKELDRSIWNYFHDRLPGSRTNMNKSELAVILERNDVKPELINGLMTIIHQCETGAYANAEMNVNKSELFENVTTILNSIDGTLVS
jgi:hypothetical protein